MRDLSLAIQLTLPGGMETTGVSHFEMKYRLLWTAPGVECCSFSNVTCLTVAERLSVACARFAFTFTSIHEVEGGILHLAVSVYADLNARMSCSKRAATTHTGRTTCWATPLHT